MSADNLGEITQLFEKARGGDKLAENRLAELLMPELRRMASVYLHRDFRGDSMETSDLVNEIYLKASPAVKTFNDSAHFKAFVATAMYHHLIDRARKIVARKKHFGERVDFEEAHQAPADGDVTESVERAMQVAKLGKAMRELEADDPRAVQVVRLKNGGLTNEEIAEALGVNVSTVKRDWRAARAYLASQMGQMRQGFGESSEP
jgi:RNA polymerase sigma factor (TIGR02999 family)